MSLRSALGHFFRRLADFFDRDAGQQAAGTRFLRAYAGTPLEIDFFAFGILFLGVLVAGIVIHGFSFTGWVLLLAAALSAGAWLIFHSAHWPERRRSLLLSFLLLTATGAASERMVALIAYLLLFFLLLNAQLRRRERGENLRSVVAVLLFCFVAYESFSALVAYSRNTALSVSSQAKLACGAGVTSRVACRAGSTQFDVPDFWQGAEGSNLIDDLQSVIALKTFQDTATENKIGFAAFTAPPESILTSLRAFFGAQKAFLRSRVPNTTRGANQPPLAIQPIMHAPDVELHTITYVSPGKPGYLADEAESTAFVLLHRRAEITWLFILDGNDFSGREFLLHRIISGFR